MANITSKTEDTSPASNDLLYTVDVSDTTDNANGSDKKVTPANLITKAHGLADGIVKVASGTMTPATANTDYQSVPAEGAFADGDKTKLNGIATGATANSSDATLLNTDNHTNGTTNKVYTATEQTKLAGVEDSADVTDATNVTSALATVPISAHSDVDTDKSKTPADGDVLTFDGTDWNAETPAAGGGSTEYIIAEQIMSGYLPSGSGWTTVAVGAGASVAASASGYIQIDLSSSFAADTAAGLVKSAGAYPQESNFGFWDIEQVWNFLFAVRTAHNSPCEMWFGTVDLAMTGSANYPTNKTREHVAVYFVADGGSETWYATCGNGSAATTTNITASMPLDEDYVRLSFKKTASDVKFYVNGTLVATHTTNLPAGAQTNGTAFHVSGGNTGTQLGTTNIIYLVSAEHKLKMF